MKTTKLMLALSLFALIGCNINTPLEVTEKPADIEYGQFTDPRDGNVYKTIKIGNQTWMAENLRYMPEVYSYENAYRGQKRYYIYGYKGNDVNEAKKYKAQSEYIGEYNEESYWKVFGTLYNNTAAQSAAPTGSRLPTQEDFQILVDRYKRDAIAALFARESYDMNWGYSVKWKLYPWFANSGFDAMPAGYINPSGYGDYAQLGTHTYYWVQNEGYSNVYYFDIVDALGRDYYTFSYSSSLRYEDRDWRGYSIRCIKE